MDFKMNRIYISVCFLQGYASALSLSADVTLIISVTFGSLLAVIIFAVIIGCLCVWYSKKQDVDLIQDNYPSRIRHNHHRNAVDPDYMSPSMMTEFEYLHNKARAEYGLIPPMGSIPGYVESNEAESLTPEFRASRAFVTERRVMNTPPPSYDQSQHDRSVTSNNPNTPAGRRDSPRSRTPPTQPLPNDIEGQDKSINSRREMEQSVHNSAMDSGSAERSNMNKASTKTVKKDNISKAAQSQQVGKPSKHTDDEIIDDSRSKRIEKGIRVINVVDPNQSKFKKMALANKMNREIQSREEIQNQSEAVGVRADEPQQHTEQNARAPRSTRNKETPLFKRRNQPEEGSSLSRNKINEMPVAVKGGYEGNGGVSKSDSGRRFVDGNRLELTPSPERSKTNINESFDEYERRGTRNSERNSPNQGFERISEQWTEDPNGITQDGGEYID